MGCLQRIHNSSALNVTPPEPIRANSEDDSSIDTTIQGTTNISNVVLSLPQRPRNDLSNDDTESSSENTSRTVQESSESIVRAAIGTPVGSQNDQTWITPLPPQRPRPNSTADQRSEDESILSNLIKRARPLPKRRPRELPRDTSNSQSSSSSSSNGSRRNHRTLVPSQNITGANSQTINAQDAFISPPESPLLVESVIVRRHNDDSSGSEHSNSAAPRRVQFPLPTAAIRDPRPAGPTSKVINGG